MKPGSGVLIGMVIGAMLLGVGSLARQAGQASAAGMGAGPVSIATGRQGDFVWLTRSDGAVRLCHAADPQASTIACSDWR